MWTERTHDPWFASLILSRGEAAGRLLAQHIERLVALPRRIRRRLARTWSLSMASAALLFALAGAPAWADTITVNSLSGGVGGPGCTLRDAITAANADAARGGCVHSGAAGADTILLPAGGTISLTMADNIANQANGLPSITSDITIEGNGTTVERGAQASNRFRLMHVGESGVLALSKVTMRAGANDGSQSEGGGAIHNRGTAVVRDSVFTGNFAEGAGGAIQNRGSMRILGSTISGNSTGVIGGGLSNSGSGTLSVYDSRIERNKADIAGDAFDHRGNDMRLVGSVVNENAGCINVEDHDSFVIIDSVISNTAGSGICMEDGNVIIEGSTISGNSGIGLAGGDTAIITNSVFADNIHHEPGEDENDGGGIYEFDRLVISGTTISGNSTSGNGGGVATYEGELIITDSTIVGNTAGMKGGGIAFTGDSLTITNSTISGNSAAEDGGGIFFGQVVARITHATIFANATGGNGGGIASRASLNIKSSIIAGSRAGGDCAGNTAFGSDNLIDDHTAGPCAGISDAAVTNLDPVLADNGGLTLTHALLAGSNAIDAGACDGLAQDQRGAARPNGTTCDVGAFEYGAVPPPRPSPTPLPTPTTPPTSTPLVPTATPPAPASGIVTCPNLDALAPQVAIDWALQQPNQVLGWNEVCFPNQPPSWWNHPRRSLTLHRIAEPYHPLFNALVFKCGCP